MKNIKNLLIMIFTFVFLFIGLKGVDAANGFSTLPKVSSFPNSIDNLGSGGFVYYSGGTIYHQSGEPDGVPHFMYKTAEGLPISCLDLGKKVPSGSCSLGGNVTQKQKYGLAKMLDLYPMTAGSYTNYFWAEVVGQMYIGGNAVGCHGSYYSYNDGKYKEAYTNDAICDAIDVAIEKMDNYATNAMKSSTISLSPSSLDTGNWTYDREKGSYLSSTITLSSSNLSNITKSITPSSPASFKSGTPSDKYQLTIPVSSVTPGTTYSMTVKVQGTAPTYYEAPVYDCGGNFQRVVFPKLKATGGGEKSATTTVTFKLTNKLSVKKVDKDSQKLIKDAKFTITGPNNYKKEVTTSDTAAVVVDNNLPFGKYCITEEVAPRGYTPYDFKNQPEKCVTFDGSVTTQDLTITLENKKTEVKISKQDIANSKEIKGATLEIVDEHQNPIDRTKEEYKCVVISPEKFINSKEISWISGDKAVTINCLPDGEYYLHEILPADGYTATEKQGTYLKFTMEDGKPKNGNVVMKNELTTVLISKLDASSKKEIKGATLSILDEAKKQIDLTEEKYANVQIVDGEFIKDKGVSWVSTGETMEIQGLPIGTYYLVEDMAPAGYVKEKEMVEIEITMDGVIAKAKINNTLKVNVPDTGMNTWGYVIIGGLLLIVGMVVVYFVTRKKA